MQLRSMQGLAVVVLSAALVAACADTPTGTPTNAVTPPQLTPQASLGNGFPQPSFDYKLNIIGVPQGKSADMDNNNGRRIFVLLSSDNEVTDPGGKNNHLAKGGDNDQNHIYLCNSTNDEGDSSDPRCTAYGNPDNWGVIDANATDGDGALLAVPDPCAGNSSIDGCTPRYSIWARARAGDWATVTTCGTEDDAYDGTADTWCGSNGITLYPRHGRKAQDVSDNLLYMTIALEGTNDELENCINGTTGVDYPAGGEYDIYLFDRCFQDYFWNYDNHGLKNLELRFYWTQ